MNCRDCCYFPCLKFVCNIGNKEGCSDFKSVVGKNLEETNKRIKDDENET